MSQESADLTFGLSGWFILGFLAYGVYKGMYYADCRQLGIHYARKNELQCWLVFILGPIGFIWTMLIFAIAFVASLLTGKLWFGFCLFMPRRFRGLE